MACEGLVREIFDVIQQRSKDMPPGSYTAYLFKEGQDKILKKIGEEAAEVIIASKSGGESQLAAEIADLVYHLLVLLAWHGMEPDDVLTVLARRRGKQN